MKTSPNIPNIIQNLVTWIILIYIVTLITGCTSQSTDDLPTIAHIPTQTIPPTEAPPTLTPSLSTIAKSIIEDATHAEIISVDINESIPILLIHFDMMGNSISVAHLHMQEILCAIQQSGRFADHNIQFRAQGHFQDALANPVYEDGIAARIDAEIIEQINCESGGRVNWDVASYYYEVHPILDNNSN